LYKRCDHLLDAGSKADFLDAGLFNGSHWESRKREVESWKEAVVGAPVKDG
jgi:hypothetical protein